MDGIVVGTASPDRLRPSQACDIQKQLGAVNASAYDVSAACTSFLYGLRAAARHYFSVEPEELTVSQASLLAGLVQAPSRLAPTGNLKGARERQKLVLASMVDSGLLEARERAGVRPAVLKVDKVEQLPNGGYFADWVLPQARDRAGGVSTECDRS